MADPRSSAPSRRTLRLTFQVSNGNVSLKSVEHLSMITPPQVGEKPQAGQNSGFWVELRDDKDIPVAHRLISPTQLNSVEVHSPDGKIRREFGTVQNGIFEVLLPDVSGVRTAVLLGSPLVRTETARATKSTGSEELVRFDIQSAQEGR